MKQLDLKSFLEFVEGLELNKPKVVHTKDDEGYVNSYTFMKITFSGYNIVLYDSPYGHAGILQDTPIAPMVDYTIEVFHDLENEGEYKVFISE